jgi:hypothetical protein
MKTIALFQILMAFLLIQGCAPSTQSHTYLGTPDPKQLDWPYRYRLTRKSDVWSGAIEYRDTNGWVFWDTMEVVRQDKDGINFRARAGDSPDTRCGWSLGLKGAPSEGFHGVLVGDFFRNRAITLYFVRSDSELSGAANWGQPARSETNRASWPASPGR